MFYFLVRFNAVSGLHMFRHFSTSFSPDLRALGFSCSLFAVRSCVRLPASTVCVSLVGALLLFHPVLQIVCLVFPCPDSWKASLLAQTDRFLLLSATVAFLESLLFALLGIWTCTWSMLYALFLILSIKGKIELPKESVFFTVLGAASAFVMQKLFFQSLLFAPKTLSDLNDKKEEQKNHPKGLISSEAVASLCVGAAVAQLTSSEVVKKAAKKVAQSLQDEYNKRRQEENYFSEGSDA
ncbi:hypothetical protein [Candidatus Similichlamydia laticola]|uniref:Transmembrane protein n=1 Tax=Candidatus Similichlamydia laticola TaxID=2170265 RepID=A0A369KFJ8_9BACT|nr:hypothetical protein [Candidatus Similichlamydia laticola]RDB31677.1 hypothetical protein HAT2_00185 [Candidatus Similichlamydia laticola]